MKKELMFVGGENLKALPKKCDSGDILTTLNITENTDMGSFVGNSL